MVHLLKWKLIINLVSRISLIVSAALLLSGGVGLLYSEKIWSFLFASLISGSLGILFFLTTRNLQDDTVKRKEAFFMVTFSWLYISLVGCLPFIFSGTIPSFTDAFFESVSGFTTTGSSILTDIEALPKSILFWRSLTHWIGGIGIIVLFIIIMPSLHEGGYHLFTLESSFQEKIQPRIKSVGQRLAYIYILLTVLETLLLLAGGMNLFESVCHTFGTVATGGFSPKNSSIGGYSAYIQYVIMIFMMLSGTNFIIHYYIYKRAFSKIKKNEEVRFYYSVILLIGTIITLVLAFKGEKPLETAFRESFFQVISIITCTGYATSDYLLWPSFAWILIFFSMFFGGSTGSTAGGIKMARHLLLIKNLKRLFRESVHTKGIFPMTLNGNIINEPVNNSILAFISLYMVIFFSGSIILSLTGLDGASSVSAAATAMAGIGPGIGTVGPASNFAHLTDLAKITMTILMILGRLEIFTVLIIFTRSFWKE
jgi:trk system potassium uptake protein